MYIEFDQLLEKIEKSSKSYDIDNIKKAYHLAEKAHEGQCRSSGELYITHPVTVAGILVDMGMDTESVIAAILHDTAEDTSVTIENIKNTFNETIADLVDGVTKIGQIPFASKEEKQAENVRKMLFAMIKDIRVIIIKLCDRLHNMRTLYARPPHKQLLKSKETMEVYAPIAHRLGITSMKEELEDISISYLDPYGYKYIEDCLNMHIQDREVIIQEIVEKLQAKMNETNSDCYIYGRVKSVYGIYRKLYVYGKEFNDIYDVYAVRIILNNINDCYNALGTMHDLFVPIPNKFKDYISIPKQNGYQSLHTTVMGKSMIPFEIQIRTWDMHYNAEYGVAAHWKYKEGIKTDSLEKKLSWVRQILETQTESTDTTDILNSIKSDIASDDIFVFTPNGDVKTLPVGSTVIDFAYSIHTDVGNSMTGAKIDGRIVPISQEVSNGQIIEILTLKNNKTGPKRDWLNVVKTTYARQKIRSWFKKEKRDENIMIGKSLLDKELKRNHINLLSSQRESFLLNLAKRQKYLTLDDFYAAIGYGEVLISNWMQRIKDEYSKLNENSLDNKENISSTKPRQSKDLRDGIIVDGMKNFNVKFAKCCTPLPGDNIIGFITKGYGISIHKTDCVNVDINSENSQRWVYVRWADDVQNFYKATVIIDSINRANLILDITTLMSKINVPIYDFNAKVVDNSQSEIKMTLGISDLNKLNEIIDKIKEVKDIKNVRRVN